MATIEVTTWDEFKAAYTAVRTEATTIQIMNDLDASDDIRTSTLYVSTSSGSNSYNLTVQGNNHKINGLSTYGSISLMGGNYRTKIHNVHFTNIFAPSGSFVTGNGTSGSYTFHLYRNCFFSGLVNVFATGSGSSRYAAFDKCSFNIKCSYFTDTSYCWYLNQCYVNINPKADGDICYILNSSSGGLFSNSISGYDINAANNNYFTGLLRSTTSTSTSTVYFAGGGSQSTNNVWNIEVQHRTPGAFWLGTATSINASSCDLYNADKCYKQGTLTTPANAGLVGLTDAQLKSASAINSAAPYFPLYGY